MSFKGTDSGQPKEWTWTIDEQFVKNPPAKHSTMSGLGTDASGQNTSIEMIEVNGKTYSKIGDVCASYDAGEAPTGNTGFTPSSVIGDIKTARLLGTDTINGVPAQHFAVDMAGLTALGAYTNGQSEVWIAQSGHFVVKYSFEATGKDTFFSGRHRRHDQVDLRTQERQPTDRDRAAQRLRQRSSGHPGHGRRRQSIGLWRADEVHQQPPLSTPS